MTENKFERLDWFETIIEFRDWSIFVLFSIRTHSFEVELSLCHSSIQMI